MTCTQFITNAGTSQAPTAQGALQEFDQNQFAAELTRRGVKVSTRTLEGWRIKRDGKAPKLPAARYENGKAIYTEAQLNLVLSGQKKSSATLEDNLFGEENPALEGYDELTADQHAAPVDNESGLSKNSCQVQNAPATTNTADLTLASNDANVDSSEGDNTPAENITDIYRGSSIAEDAATRATSLDDSEEVAAMDAAKEEIPPVEEPPMQSLALLDSALGIKERRLDTLDDYADCISSLSLNRGRIDAAFTILIGQKLIEAKKLAGHGQWAKWLAENEYFGYTQQYANKIMRVAARWGDGKLKDIFQFNRSQLIALLDVPEGEEQEFIEEQKANGNPVENQTESALKANIKKSQAAKKPAPDVDNEEEVGKGNSIYANLLGKQSAQEAINEITGDTPATQIETPDVTSAPSTIITTAEDNKNNPIYTGNPEWYTQEKYIEAAREVLGAIDLDPASSEIAQQNVKAAKYFTAADDGLQYDWHGRIWLNPPYKKELVEKFVDKLLASDFDSAIILVRNATETAWFQKLAQQANVICFTNHRPKFYRPDGSFGNGAPRDSSAFFYFGTSPEIFCEVFQQFGWFAKFIPVATQGEVIES